MIQRLIPGLNPVAPRRTAESKKAPAAQPAIFSSGQDTVSFSRAASLPVKFGARPQDPDFRRYHDILKEIARQDLKQFKSPKDFEVSKDGKSVKMPQDYIDTPSFTRGANEGAVGQGQGDPGDEVGQMGQNGLPQPAPGTQPGQPGEPGEGEGEGDEAGGDGSGDLSDDDWNTNISRMEVAQWIGEGLELPNFEPRGHNNIQKIIEVPKSIDRVGRKRLMRKTLLEAIRREMAAQGEDFSLDQFLKNFMIQKPDFRYLGFRDQPIPKENAVVFYLIDTSGSMGAKEKQMARDTNFYLSTYLQAQYGQINAELRGEKASDEDFGNGVEEVFITHDVEAEEVSEKEFYTKSKGSATNFSPAFTKIKELIQEKYPPEDYNIYIFHYTDGDNFASDHAASAKVMKELMEMGLNLYGYIETAPSGRTYKEELNKNFGPDNQYVRKGLVRETTPEEYRKVIRQMLGREEERKQATSGGGNTSTPDWGAGW